MLTRTSMQALLDVQQPLNKLYSLEFKDPSVLISQVFNEQSMDSAEEREKNSYGVGPLENVGEGGAVPYDDIGLGYDTVYAYQVLKKGIQITKQLAQDNKYTEMNNRIKWLAQRASYDPVNYAFGFLRNGFTANPSGYANFNNGALALFSASQTYENGASGTQSNYSTAALNYDNFNLGMVNLMEQKSSHGTLIEFMGGLTLVVPPALKKTAVAITESELDPDTAENAINVYKGACKVVVVPFLGAAGGGSDTAWYLMAKGHKLNFKWRTRPEYDTEVDFDTGVSKHKVEAEYIMGASDWRGTYGSTGTV